MQFISRFHETRRDELRVVTDASELRSVLAGEEVTIRARLDYRLLLVWP